MEQLLTLKRLPKPKQPGNKRGDSSPSSRVSCIFGYSAAGSGRTDGDVFAILHFSSAKTHPMSATGLEIDSDIVSGAEMNC